MNVLHLATAKPSKHFIKACNDLGHTYKHFHPEDLYFEVSESTKGFAAHLGLIFHTTGQAEYLA
jgi:hypothetical protein